MMRMGVGWETIAFERTPLEKLQEMEVWKLPQVEREKRIRKRGKIKEKRTRKRIRKG